MSMLLAALMASGCAHIAESSTFLTFNPRVARPGTVLDVRLQYVDGPMGPQPVPDKCVSGWRVSGAGVTFDRRRLQLHIGADAVPGQPVSLRVKIHGKRMDTPIVVHGPDEPVLEGVWVRSGSACDALRYVELVFDGQGRLTYTSEERMVETMSDGTRPYTWDAAAGRIDSTLFDGGSAPVDIDGDRLALHLAGCEATFVRR